MYIKQVIIEGFKSYKDQLISDQFSPKINAVVGANGSGKSNFFHAIRFVLSDIFTNLRQEDRVKLLHEGAGHHVLSSYVEVVFDNSDNRFPVDRDEVRLRRTIGVKKDEYFLDKKHITKAEVMNFLESAGFSRANPYYVVQQGKIMKMSTMKDAERLDLLKEIGGTKVYEERRRESLKIMQENEVRKNQIQEVVDQLDEKLSELDAEREELHRYQQLDKQRRGLEYALYDKELTDARKKLDEIEAQRSSVSKSAGQHQDEVEQASEKIRELQEDLRGAKAALKDSAAQLKSQRERKQELMEAKTAADMEVKDLHERIGMESSSTASAQQELAGLTQQIAKARSDLEHMQGVLKSHEDKENRLLQESAECTRRQQFLYGKQGDNFGSKAEKDAWVMRKIEDAQRLMKKDNSATTSISSQMESLQLQLLQAQQEEEEVQNSALGGSAEIQETEKQLSAIKSKVNGLQNRRRELWREETALGSKCAQLQDELVKKERQLYSTVNYDTNQGLKSCKRAVDEQRVSGVHGALIELLHCDPKLHTAVEVAAGNRLFNYVVEGEEVAAAILQHMKKLPGGKGRVTLMPLANLQRSNVTYPTEFGTDAVPLIKKLKYPEPIKAAVEQIFGKIMICRDLETAQQVSRSTNFDSITLDGDRVDNRGPITGGYNDGRHSKMDAMKSIKDIVELLGTTTKEKKAVAEELQNIDQEVTQCMGEQKQLEVQLMHLRSATDQRRTDDRARQRLLSSTQKQLQSLEKQREDCQRRIEEQKAKVTELQVELGSELLSQLTREEQSELEQLNTRLQLLKEELSQAQTSKLQGQVAVQELEDLLTGNLQQRQQELQDLLVQQDIDSEQRALQQLQSEATDADAALQEAIQTEGQMRGKTDQLKQQTQELKKELEQQLAAKEALEESAREQERKLDTLLSRRTQYSQRQDDVSKKIRELGSLPSDAFEKYKNKGTKDLHRLLKNVGDELKQFSHVNKKALEQYVTFTEQREDLLKRQAELQAGEVKIKELVRALDMRKDEAIERTFKGVAKHFREIFAELAPGGRGELVMQKRVAGNPSEDAADEAEDDMAEEAHEKYSGVKVRISFGMGEVQTMQQLSGGQKTMVALTLIFAIQRCDPAPFYLFDEIDAALDSQYRTTVARMLEKQMEDARNPAQFIITTFHPQIVNVCDKIYGVSHSNRISRVDIITRDEALAFLASEEVREGAVAEDEGEEEEDGAGPPDAMEVDGGEGQQAIMVE